MRSAIATSATTPIHSCAQMLQISGKISPSRFRPETSFYNIGPDSNVIFVGIFGSQTSINRPTMWPKLKKIFSCFSCSYSERLCNHLCGELEQIFAK